MNELPFDLPRFEPGWVWIAGAGPGDPGLLTLHVVNGLRQADVVVYDALVSEEILTLVPVTTERVYAGKRGGRPSTDQADISLRLVAYAKKGKRVLRLKGGDPFVFGRGGEEAQALHRAGVPFRILPGITAGVGGLAYAGIPLTHRNVNSAVTFVTGHTAGEGGPGGVDWEAVAKGAPVLVIYMALNQIAALAERLIEAGRPENEPAAVISRATLSDQTVLVTTLGRAAKDVAAEKPPPPAMLVVGRAVALRDEIAWFEAIARETV